MNTEALRNQYGLLGVKAFFPATAQEGTPVICECVFRNEGAFESLRSGTRTT